MNTKVWLMSGTLAYTVACGTQVGGEGCFSDDSQPLTDASITPQGWDQTAESALQHLALNTYAEGNATIEGQSVPITFNLQLDAGEELATFPGEATTENGCSDWVIKSGTLVLLEAIEGRPPVDVRLMPEVWIQESFSAEEAESIFGEPAPNGETERVLSARLTDDTWRGTLQWLSDDDEGPFIEFEVSAVQ